MTDWSTDAPFVREAQAASSAVRPNQIMADSELRTDLASVGVCRGWNPEMMAELR